MATHLDPDGPYVTYLGLSLPGQRFMANNALLPLIEVKLPDLRAEAELYLLVNGGGIMQTDEDMERAARVVAEEMREE